jgi:hypothetical protein
MAPTIKQRILPVPLSSTGLAQTATWSNLVQQVIANHTDSRVRALPMSLVLGLIYAESRGNPNAASGSVNDWFSSFGLMQINAQTWWRDSGQPLSALMDPLTNVRLGASILAQKIAAWGNEEAGVSAYNGGGKRYPAGTRFCQVWKPGTPTTGRTIDADCAIVYITGENEFGNQPYVDEVFAAANHFGFGVPSPASIQPAPNISVAGMGETGGSVTAWAVAVGTLLAVGYLVGKLFR